MLRRRTLWSVLVSALAAIPALQGVRGAAPVLPGEHEAPVPAASADLRTEAAPLPEQRRELEQTAVRDEHDDAPAPHAVAALFAPAPSHPLFSEVDRAARGLPAPDADLAPTARRALGRPRVRAPDVTARL